MPTNPHWLRRQHCRRRPTPASLWWWAGVHSACPACPARDAVIGTCQTAAAHFRKSTGAFTILLPAGAANAPSRGYWVSVAAPTPAQFSPRLPSSAHRATLLHRVVALPQRGPVPSPCHQRNSMQGVGGPSGVSGSQNSWEGLRLHKACPGGRGLQPTGPWLQDLPPWLIIGFQGRQEEVGLGFGFGFRI